MRRSQSQWLALISECESSGVSAADFCRERGINAQYFSVRKQQLTRSDFVQVTPVKPVTESASKHSSNHASNNDTRPKVAPKTALGKAPHYLNHQWPRLIGYLEDGRSPIDNNPVEKAIRLFVIGRNANSRKF